MLFVRHARLEEWYRAVPGLAEGPKAFAAYVSNQHPNPTHDCSTSAFDATQIKVVQPSPGRIPTRCFHHLVDSWRRRTHGFEAAVPRKHLHTHHICLEYSSKRKVHVAH